MADVSSLCIHEANVAYFAEIEALLVDVYVGEGFTPAEHSSSLRAVAERACHTEMFVAVDRVRGALVGTVCLIPPGTPSSQIARAGEWEVRLLAVAPEARRQSLGELLMKACTVRAEERGASQVVLSTQVTMLAAQRLYERMGFRRDAARDWVRPSSGRRMLVYVLQLDQPLEA